jgi:hypothetical protein
LGSAASASEGQRPLAIDITDGGGDIALILTVEGSGALRDRQAGWSPRTDRS